MKLKILFLALFVAGIAASIALASPADNGSAGTTATTGTTTTSTGKHGGKGDDGEHAKKDKTAKCRNVELRGTLAPGSLTVAVDKAGGPGKALVGSSATLIVGGHVRVSALLCAAGAGQTLELRQLKADKAGDDGSKTTTTTTTTTTTP